MIGKMVNCNKRKNSKGFTLIELIVVIAILGILAAFIAPRLMGFQETARERSDEQIAAIVANAAVIHIAELDSFSGIGTGLTYATPDALLTKLVNENLIESTYDTVAHIEAALKSNKYVGFDMAYSTTTNVLTVTLSDSDTATTTGDYVLTK